MNYTEEVRKEIIDQVDAKENGHYFLLAQAKMCAYIDVFKKNKFNLIFELRDEHISMLLYQIIKDLYNVPLELGYTNVDPKIYTLTIEGIYAKDILKSMNLSYVDEDGFSLDKSNQDILKIKTQEEASAYIQGIFVSSGSVYFPEGAGSERGYHIELNFIDNEQCKKVQKLLEKYQISLAYLDRESTFALYAKSAETVSDMLAFMKAMNAVLKLNEVNIVREVNSKLNRESNILAANYEKTLAANIKYISAIEILQKKIGLENIDDEKMLKVCKARLADKQSSLSELSVKLNMTKSSLNRMLNKILTKAKNINGGEI